MADLQWGALRNLRRQGRTTSVVPYAARRVAVEKAAVNRRRSNAHSALTPMLASVRLDGYPPIREVGPITIGIRRRRGNGLLGLPDEVRSVRRGMEHFVERSDEPAGRYLARILPSLARDLPSPPTRIRKGINDKQHNNSSDHELHLVNLPRWVFCEMLAGFVRRRVTVQVQGTRATRNPPMVPQAGPSAVRRLTCSTELVRIVQPTLTHYRNSKRRNTTSTWN